MVGAVDIAVSDAAARLGVDDSRVRQLLRSGGLAGRHIGSIWLVDAADVARLAGRRRPAGRPMSSVRAWAALDLLGDGSADWLSPSARSQVRALVRSLANADADRWRSALSSRSEVHRVRAHPAAIPRLSAASRVLSAGAGQASLAGLDLVVVGDVPELYVAAEAWPRLAAKYKLQRRVTDTNLVVRVPRGVWPFARQGKVSAEALAADLLESAEPRARRAATEFLRARAAKLTRNRP